MNKSLKVGEDEKNELKEKGFAYLGKGEEKRGFALFSYVSVLDERCEK